MNLPTSLSRRSHVAWLLAGLIGCSIRLTAATPNTQNLFNGRDLTGWEGNTTFWSVRDGMIVGQTTAEKPT